MSVLNRPTTGSGLIDELGNAISFARCSLAGLVLETGVLTVKETGNVTTLPTTAFLGYSFPIPGSVSLTGSIEGYVKAVDANGTTGLAAISGNTPRTNVPVAFEMFSGGFHVAGYVLLFDADFRTGPNEISSIRWELVMIGHPTIRKVYAMTEIV